MALDKLARVIAKKHSQWGVNFEDELVKKFHKTKKMPKIPLMLLHPWQVRLMPKTHIQEGIRRLYLFIQRLLQEQ